MEGTPNLAKLTLEEARDWLLIDRHNLDGACIHQANLFYCVSEKYVQTVSKKDLAKENLAVVDAEKDAEIRDAAKIVSAKLTETLIQKSITNSEEHKEAFKYYAQCCKEAELWKVMKESYLQKSSMLKELCSLFISNYYADVTVKSSESVSDDARYKGRRKRNAEKQNTSGEEVHGS